jgi:hypothetical protein
VAGTHLFALANVIKLFEIVKGAKSALDTIGVAEVYRQIQAWHQQYGERWALSPLLCQLAESGTPPREAKPLRLISNRPTARIRVAPLENRRRHPRR